MIRFQLVDGNGLGTATFSVMVILSIRRSGGTWRFRLVVQPAFHRIVCQVEMEHPGREAAEKGDRFFGELGQNGLQFVKKHFYDNKARLSGQSF